MTRASGSDHKDDGVLSGADRQPRERDGSSPHVKEEEVAEH